MFSNSYQKPYFEVYNSRDGKTANGNREKMKFYQQLLDQSSSKYIYDDELKTYILHSKILKLPKSGDLSLVHQYVGFQLKPEQQLHIELLVVDIKNIRRRIFITTTKKNEIKPFFIMMSITTTLEWTTIIIDLVSFIKAYSNSVYRSLEAISITSSCQVRRIFMLQQLDSNLLNQIQLPFGIECKNICIQYQQQFELDVNYQIVEQKDSQQIQQNLEKLEVFKQNQRQIMKKKQQQQKKIEQQIQLTQKPQNYQKEKENLNKLSSNLKQQECQQSNKLIMNNEISENNSLCINENYKQNDNKENNYEKNDLFAIEKMISIIENSNMKENVPSNDSKFNQQKSKELIENEDNEFMEINKNNHIIAHQQSIGTTTITKKSGKTCVIESRKEQGQFVKLVFDPILNCYYDPETKQCFF